MHLSVGASKINKWAVRESGDTLEMIERPHGGISFVLADGQSSGEAAKAISIRVVRKVVSELAEGNFLHPRNVVQEDDVVAVRILSIDGKRRRMGLSLRQAGWPGAAGS